MLERIQKIVKEYNLSPTVFADKIDIPKANVSHVLNGRNKPSLDFVLKISEAFPEINLEWILKGTGTMKKIEVKNTSPNILATPPAPSNPELFYPKSESTPRKENETKIKTVPEKNDEKITLKNEKKKTKSDKEMKKIILLYDDNTFDYYDKNIDDK